MSVIPNLGKAKLLSGELTIGTGVRIARTADIGMALSACGFDWMMIEMEHGVIDLDAASGIAVAALGQGITPLVRVSSLSDPVMTKILDAGAQGIVLPHTRDACEARALVARCRFPPDGERSVSGMMAHTAYRPTPAKTLTASLNAQLLLVAMIETAEASQNADEIAAVDGIDVLMIGTNDLATVLGVPGEYEHPVVDRAFAQVIDACRRHGKVAGFPGARRPPRPRLHPFRPVGPLGRGDHLRR